MKKNFLIFSLLLLSNFGFGQSLSNWRTLTILQTTDTIKIDSLSIVKGSLTVSDSNGVVISPSSYYFHALKSRFYLRQEGTQDSLYLKYRVLPSDFTAVVFNKDTSIIQKNLFTENPFAYKVKKENALKIFDESSLERNGSISRGLVLGNRQNLSVNSDFNLQLSGRISDKIEILANISDDNIPIQAEGNTQQLQEFDNIFIKLFDEKSSLIAGDFRMDFAKGKFMRYGKKARGLNYIYTSKKNKTDSIIGLKLGASVAVSKGKFARNIFNGIEGNQGPYRMRGAENELFIIVLSGTERVFIDGELQTRGSDKDYVIDYNSSEITFTSKVLVTKDLRISVDFQYSDKNYARSVITSDVEMNKVKSSWFFNFYSEQDSKNQSLQQDLSDTETSLLASIGDNLDQAVISSIDSAIYSDSEVLYQLIDSLGFDSVFVYRPDPDATNYRLSFSFVGEAKGDYIQDGFTPNGRKFRWVAPDTLSGNVIRQGDYAPVRRLISPQKRQLLTARYQLSPNNGRQFYIEGSISNQDLNTFAAADDADNVGLGLNVGLSQKISLNKKTDLTLNVDHEYRDNRFQSIERYREVEFNINWNYLFPEILGDQHLTTLGLGISRDRSNFINWKFNSLLEEKNYEGFKNDLNSFMEK